MGLRRNVAPSVSASRRMTGSSNPEITTIRAVGASNRNKCTSSSPIEITHADIRQQYVRNLASQPCSSIFKPCARDDLIPSVAERFLVEFTERFVVLEDQQLSCLSL